jgi:hypothetical protein
MYGIFRNVTVTQYGPKREIFIFTGLVLPVGFGFCFVSKDSVVSIATGYGLGDRGVGV